jgi:hypothetical protein
MLGLLAIVSGLCLSAFTAEQAKKSAGKTDVYYWYLVTYDALHPAGHIPNSGAVRFGGNQEDKSYADANDGCQIEGLRDCLRGFLSQLTSFPQADPGDEHTTKP